MAGYYATPILPLARGKVRYVGEPVVGVVAESRYLAEDALELIAIEFEPLPAVVDPARPRCAGAPLLHEEAGTNVLVAREFKRGDVDAAMRGGAGARQGRFRMRRKTAVAIEPRACLAEYEPGRDALTLHSATQIPGIVRDALAEALDLPGHRLRVVAPDVGGGFGGKGSLYPEEIFVCAAARQLARVGQMDQRPHGGSDRHQPGLRRDRRRRARRSIATAHVLALRADAIGDVGAYSIYPWTAALEPVQVVSFLPGPYRIAALSRPRRGRWRPRRRRPALIAASGGRSRPSSWSG